MRRFCLVWVMSIAAGVSLIAQTSTPPPQSARQALIEMFMSKNSDDFSKHLPDAARQALIHKGETAETSVVLRIATLGRGLVAQGEHIETFDVGPNILVSEHADHHERLEVAVEHDSLMGEQDEIELSVHYYKDDREQEIPVVPRLTFTLNQEKDLWRLTEVTVAAHVPLTDPDYLKGLRKQQEEANENAAQIRINMIIATQTGYAAAHPDAGYSCRLSSLMPQSPQPTAPESGTSSDPAPANDESNGYRFTLSSCGGPPSTRYRLTAVPTDPDSGGKIFCADESGNVKFVMGGKPTSCFSSGQLVNPAVQYPPVETD